MVQVSQIYMSGWYILWNCSYPGRWMGAGFTFSCWNFLCPFRFFYVSVYREDKVWNIIRAVYDKTDNPLKRFLLICIMIELGMNEYVNHLVTLVSESNSTSIVEMSFFKIKESLIRCDKRKIPDNLITAFKKIYNIKARRNGENKRKSDYIYNIEISDIQKNHIRHLQERLSGKTSDIEVLIQNDWLWN